MPVVPDLDEFKDGGARLSAGLELASQAFRFQSAEEALHDCIVITVAGAAHADLALQFSQALLVGGTGVLGAPVRVMKQTRSWAAASNCHVKGIFDL